MNTFLIYDQFRLRNYEIVNNGIEYGSTPPYAYNRFDDVGYFNYVFIKNLSFKKDELIAVFAKYRNVERERVKVIFPVGMENDLSYLIDNENPCKGIVSLRRDYAGNEVSEPRSIVLSKVCSEEELSLFTKMYLVGFESKRPDIRNVYLNFKLLYDLPSVDFFLIKHRNHYIGICSNFYHGDMVFLSACTVLHQFRNRGFQKEAIQARIEFASGKGYSIFTTWCYRNSVSHQNLLKKKFSDVAIYHECISKHLDTITKQGGILSE